MWEGVPFSECLLEWEGQTQYGVARTKFCNTVEGGEILFWTTVAL
jgi:hypothetical protein